MYTIKNTNVLSRINIFSRPSFRTRRRSGDGTSERSSRHDDEPFSLTVHEGQVAGKDAAFDTLCLHAGYGPDATASRGVPCLW